MIHHLASTLALLPCISRAGSCLCALVAVALLQTTMPKGRSAPPDFFLRDGDRIVITGDSITVEGLYVRYIENFLRTRFPQWKIMVRNAGINGQIAKGGFEVIQTDVLDWKPTVVIVNYGMNDGRRPNGAAIYREGIVPYVDKLIAEKVRVVLCSNSPLDLGDAPGEYTDYNRTFHEMALFAEQFARERRIPFVDQFHFCHTLWGENRRRSKPIPVSHQTTVPYPTDAVHARGPGQLTMAYIILKTLSAPREISAASVDAISGAAETNRCTISAFQRLPAGGGITFVRADEASPCWIEDQGQFPGHLGLELVPFMAELNVMPLRIRGLSAGSYELRIEGHLAGRYSADQLARGVDLAHDRKSPVYEPGKRVDKRVATQRAETYEARQVRFFQTPSWLNVPGLPAQKEAEFARRQAALEKFDAEIQAAAAPRPLRYEVRRVNAE